MTTFRRNAIIAGYINSYCLVCECFFETEEQTFSHIEGEEHETRQLLYPYLEKYGNNNIRKVKAGYFCEHCSLLMATAAKVNLHIAEKVHYYTKGNSLLKQCGSVFTAFDDVLISDSAWHSFMEDTCALCDAEFDDAYEHKMERSHILKLLQNKVRFGEDNNIYRKVKAGYFCEHCSLLMATAAKVNLHIAEKVHYYTKGNSLLKQCGSVFTAFDDVLISDSAWHSFMEDTCALCDAEFDDAYEHKMERSHILKLLQNKVRFGEDNNIYRKVRPDSFHCAFCNLMIPGWTAVEKHLKSSEHKTSAASCHRRLQIHLPAIKAQKNDEQAKTAFLEFVNHIKFN